MRHKHAKRAIREQERSKRYYSLYPSLIHSSNRWPGTHPTRPGASGDALSSEAARRWEDGQKERKRRKIDGARDTQIPPGETFAHFNNPPHNTRTALLTWSPPHHPLLPPTSKPIRTHQNRADKTNSTASKSKPAASADAAPPIHVEKHVSRPKEFARTSSAAPHRLYDIAQAPPEFSSFAHKKSADPILSLSGNNQTTGTPAGKASILSPAQQLAMAVAREDAVRSYRRLRVPDDVYEGVLERLGSE
ncbi:hypothetical protein B0H14DRAFT_2657991 [Mycena olivaceomarginata]|nr:hypothetical protein B0H14DRAFT_2657991 [Mycena olivaceomarginata]